MQIGTIRIDKTYIHETMRYLLFGLSGSGVSYACYILFTRAFEISFIPATLMASFLANTYGYFVNNKFVFISAQSESQGRDSSLRYLQYLSSRLFLCFTESVVLSYFIDTLGMYDIMVKCVSGSVVGILNYLFTKLVIFAEKNDRFAGYVKSVEGKYAHLRSSVRSRWYTRYL